MNSAPADYDLAIVGGGLVGASLALSLAPLGLRIALIEAVAPVQGEQHPSFDERTTALANGTVRAFKTLGVWAAMEREAAPIRKIHVSDQGRFGIGAHRCGRAGARGAGLRGAEPGHRRGTVASARARAGRRSHRAGAGHGQRTRRRRAVASLLQSTASRAP